MKFGQTLGGVMQIVLWKSMKIVVKEHKLVWDPKTYFIENLESNS